MGSMVYETGELVEPPKVDPDVGVKIAVSESVPTGRAVVAVVAEPLLTATGLPMGVLPTSNCTVPVALDGAIVAPNEIDVPANCGLTGFGVLSVVVAIGSISYETGELVEGPKSEPAEGVKTAESESVPIGRAVVAVEALPPETVAGLPRAAPPTSNWTEPVELDGETVALNVTEVPAACGLAGLGGLSVVVVATAVITYETGELVEGPKLEPDDGVKTAVMESVPAGRSVVAVEAVPPVTVTGLPRSTPPTSNWTEPVAVDGEMLALNVTDVPAACGLAGVGALRVVVVVVVAGEMVYVSVPVEPAYPLPEAGVKMALRASDPTGNAVVGKDTDPPVTVTGLPIGVPPISNWTVPVAAAGVTAAFSVTDVPDC
jgi:hypothetical protein